MGMNFSPMYQPVSTKTIKADGDLNVSPYDVIAYDGNFDTVEADEFVGGVGNFSSIVMPTLSYDGYMDILTPGLGEYTILSSPFPLNGVVSIKSVGGNDITSRQLRLITASGIVSYNIGSTQTEYTVSNTYSIMIYLTGNNAGTPFSTVTNTVGVFKFI